MVGGEIEKQITIDEGTTITADFLKSHITVEGGYEVEGFYTDEAYTDKFDFTTALNSDVTIYARIAEIPTEPEKPEQKPEEKPGTDNNEKDEVPQTGVENYLGMAVLGIMLSVGAMIYTRNKQNKE